MPRRLQLRLPSRMVNDPNRYIEEILDDPEYLSSMVVYLNGIGEHISREVLHCLAVDSKSVPSLGLEWLEILLTHCLYGDAERFKDIDPVLRAIRHELGQIGALEHRRVVLRNPADHAKLLTTAAAGASTKENPRKLYATGSAGLATLVRGSSRRIKIMRFRPANIRLINRRQNLPQLLLALSLNNGKNKNNPIDVQELTGSLQIRAP